MYNWWEEKGVELANSINTQVCYIQADLSSKTQNDVINYLLYDSSAQNTANLPTSTLANMALEGMSSAKSFSTYNVVFACVETLVSKIGKAQPRPKFTSNDGDFEVRQQVKKLNKFILGQFKSLDLYRVGRAVLKDACIFGTGVMKCYRDNNKIKVEKVMPYEILIDRTQGQWKEPQQMFQVKNIDSNVLIALYPEHRSAIEAAASKDTLSSTSTQSVQVIEAWKLPSYDGAEDGKHAICIENACFLEEDYEKSYFPFLFLHFSERPCGFWSKGVAEQLRGIQRHINKTLMTIEQCLDLLGVPWIMVERNAQIDKGSFNNRVGNVIRYTRTPPSIYISNVVPPDLFRHLEDLYQKAFEIVGVSQLSAASQKPAGLNSGVALREFSDIESERFLALGTAYQDWFMSIAPRLIDLSKEIAEDEDLTAPVDEGSHYSKLDFKEVDLERDQYSIQAWPANLLSDKPEGKLAQINDLMNLGLIDPESAKELLGMPDLEKYQSLATAKQESIRKIVDKVADTGDYIPLEPYMDLAFGLDYAEKVYSSCLVEEYPEANLNALRQMIDDLTAELQAQQPPPAPAMPEQAPPAEAMPPMPAGPEMPPM